MSKLKYQQDLHQIRHLMERSTRYLSLSGWASIMAGVYGLLGAYWAHRLIEPHFLSSSYGDGAMPVTLIRNILGVGIGTAAVAIITAIWLCYRKAHKAGEPLWTPAASRLVLHFSIPIIIGAVVILLLLFRFNNMWILAGALSMIFYALALWNASIHSYSQIRWLAIAVGLLGILALIIPRYTLILWALGFGVSHILYGLYHYITIDRADTHS